MAAIVRKPQMNRLYVTGDVEHLLELLSDFHARHDSTGYWLPLWQESALRSAIAAEQGYQAAKVAQRAEWERAKAVIPGNYKTRHGAALGGTVVIDGERLEEPALATHNLPWVMVAEWTDRVRDLTGQSVIAGRVRRSETLYSAAGVDGRALYRISHYSDFGDDLRETYFLPADLWAKLLAAEVQARGITAASAREWLDRYRGCVGTELYDFAASEQGVLMCTK
jgi:hypothetical protein